MSISPARVAAVEILGRIEKEHAFSSVLLPIYEADMSASDRGLCHELVLGVLRRQMYLDKIADHFTGGKKLDPEVRIALRIGIYQLLFLDRIPAYSAINESVSLVQRARKTSAKGLVNAVLRRVSEGVPLSEYGDELERISVETSHPRWLLEKWTADFGAEEAENLAKANNSQPRAAFRLTARSNAARFGEFEKSELLDDCFIASSGDSNLRAMADAGEIYFQDEASQLVGRAVMSRPVTRFLDVCAAPGGKTTQIAAGVDGGGRVVVAGDLHAARVRLLSRTCQLQGVEFVQTLQYDAEASLPFADESFDTVLVDAPCSGTGTIRHNPEIRYFVQPGDFDELRNKQLTILRNASKTVQPGGRLIYSTCSLQTEENESVCRAFLDEVNEFRQITPQLDTRFLTAEGFARTFPHRDGIDGFFIAEFERRSDKFRE